MNLFLFIIPYVLFILVYAVFKIHYSHWHIVQDSELEEALKTADEYEIAVLKGGEKFAKQLTFYHLLKGGYLDKMKNEEAGESKYYYKATASKDQSVLHNIEKDILIMFQSSKDLLDLYDYNIPSLKQYQRKISSLNLLHDFKLINKIYTYFAWIFTIIYLLFGRFPDAWIRPFFAIAINWGAGCIIWSIIFKKNDYNYYDDMLISRNGLKYVELFERKYFVLPDFKTDKLFKEAEEFNPC